MVRDFTPLLITKGYGGRNLGDYYAFPFVVQLLEYPDQTRQRAKAIATHQQMQHVHRQFANDARLDEAVNYLTLVVLSQLGILNERDHFRGTEHSAERFEIAQPPVETVVVSRYLKCCLRVSPRRRSS